MQPILKVSLADVNIGCAASCRSSLQMWLSSMRRLRPLTAS